MSIDAVKPDAAASSTARRVPTDFDWQVYADATFAGLSLLVPIPLLDGILEEYFRRRMPRSIARRRGRTLSLAVLRELNRARDGLWPGCLFWPVRAAMIVLRMIFRNLVYVFSVVDASEKLSYYWHRAFLLDYMIIRGDLDSHARAEIGARAMQEILATTRTSPLLNLATETIEQARHHLRALSRAIFRFLRRQKETQEFERTRTTLAQRWAAFQDYFIELAGRYDAAYAAVQQQREAAATQPGS